MNCFVTGRRRSRRGRARTIRFWNNSECASPIWTKIGTTKQLDTKNKPVMYFLKILKIDPTRRGQRSKFYLILTRNHVLTCHSDSAGPMWTKIGKVKQLDPGNKHLVAFLQNLRIWPHTGRSKFKIWPNLDPKSRFGLSFGFGWSDVDKNWHSEATWPWKHAFCGVFTKFANLTPHRKVKVQNLT